MSVKRSPADRHAATEVAAVADGAGGLSGRAGSVPVGRRGAVVAGVGRAAGVVSDREHGRGVGNGFARSGVLEIQRTRILAALVEVARERGAGQVTVAHIVARSGVSRRTFYELFEDRDACFLAAFEDAVQRASAHVAPVFGRAGSWRERMRGALGAVLEFLDDERRLGGLCIVDALAAGSRALERRAEVVSILVDAVDEGRGEARAVTSLSRLTAEGVVGGVLAVLHARLSENGPASDASKPLVQLQSPLMAMIVLPYLGTGVAGREAARPAPPARPRPRRARSNPLEGLGMRLTYRTVRVLAAIASNPKASNRQVADTAGIQDQGQISKLLARLEHLGLIENITATQARGEPNAWRLTPKGHEVQGAIEQQSTPATS
jgi:AcrR family transcriptional regulator/DNA-binding MarR family transcriptional regulator